MGNIQASGFTPPSEVYLDAVKGKGLQVEGTFSRREGTIYMEMTFSNKAMQQLRKEYPDLDKDIRTDQRNSQVAKFQGPSAIQALIQNSQ